MKVSRGPGNHCLLSVVAIQTALATPFTPVQMTYTNSMGEVLCNVLRVVSGSLEVIRVCHSQPKGRGVEPQRPACDLWASLSKMPPYPLPMKQMKQMINIKNNSMNETIPNSTFQTS